MTRLVLDSETVKKLCAAHERVEVCDSNGKTLGYFLPSTDRGLYKIFDCPFTAEEIERARNEPGGRSLQEILADLQKRA
jgi:hypothetical protein